MKWLEEAEGLVSSKITIVQALMRVITLETKLAGLSIFPLLLTVCLLLVVLMSLWFTSMLLLGYFIAISLHSLMLTLMALVVLNGLFLGLVVNSLASNLKKMSFEKTRELLLHKEHNRE